MGNAFKPMIFHPPSEPSYIKDSSIIWLKTKSNEQLPSVFVDRNAEFTILLSYANAEDLGIAMNYYITECGLPNCVNLFFYDYPGYGYSTGEATEIGMYEAIEAAYNYISESLFIPPSKLILYGRSLGTAACCHLASKFPTQGVILQSPMLSLYRICFPLRFNLPGDMLCNIDKIDKIKCPVFIIHGTNDEIIPFSHGLRLFQMCKSCVNPLWIEGGNHNNLDSFDSIGFSENVKQFIQNLRHLTYK